MGVPGFFSWLLKQYKEDKLVIDNLPNKPNILYIDANCLFHPQCFKILEGSPKEKDTNLLESKMIKRILNYIDYLIGYVDPQKMVYLSVDGVAPLAKINQQRKRRFRSIDDAALKDNIKKKHGIESNNSWNNTVITPGTEFMENLHESIINHFKNKKNMVEITYSSYHTPGEGEHKVLQHIKKYNTTSKNTSYVIYGLDADLFFLSMASQVNNIYLLREDSQFSGINRQVDELYDLVEDVAEDLKFVSIDITKKCYNEQIKNIIKSKIEQRLNTVNNVKLDTDFCNDFIFLCYLLGNDFLPHFPSIDIKKYGLDTILDCYTDIYIQYEQNILSIVNDEPEINDYIFGELIRKIASYEYDFFTKTMPQMKNRTKYRKCMSEDKYLQEMWNIENMKNIDIDDPIKLGIGEESEWKFRYYEHYFHSNEYQELAINEACNCYLVGLKWVTQYYFKSCPDWKWQYFYNHAPFISDIYNHLQYFNFKNIKFDIHEPLNCCVQLLCVLPPKCKNILPKSFQDFIVSKDSSIIDMFPEKVNLDMINKDLYWQCIPLIPVLDVDSILFCVEKIKLKKDEKIRNSIFKDIIFN